MFCFLTAVILSSIRLIKGIGSLLTAGFTYTGAQLLYSGRGFSNICLALSLSSFILHSFNFLWFFWFPDVICELASLPCRSLPLSLSSHRDICALYPFVFFLLKWKGDVEVFTSAYRSQKHLHTDDPARRNICWFKTGHRRAIKAENWVVFTYFRPLKPNYKSSNLFFLVALFYMVQG